MGWLDGDFAEVDTLLSQQKNIGKPIGSAYIFLRQNLIKPQER